MKKISAFLFISLTLAGCSSNSSKQELFYEAAAACSQVCETHTNIQEIASSAGGGLPLLFFGKMETSCQCNR